VFQTQKALDEVGDKVDAAEREKVQAEIDSLKAVVERTNPEELSDSDIDELKAGKEKLMEAAQAVFTKMYEQQAQAGGAAGPDMSNMGAAGDNMGGGANDDVVDGDYREV
jgi:molecular chaperone DnaK